MNANNKTGDPNIITGTFDIEPNDFMKKEFQKSIDKAGNVGLHLVHIFFIGPITEVLEVRKAYFDTFGEADSYAWYYDKEHKDKNNDELATYLIYINCELRYAHFKGKYVGDFMGLQKKRLEEHKSEAN
ncbi:hypothetical protein bpr_II093 (plasmid) [Butyrivibrio proteoclasticus B316]|uniref:Uncharacterized protein n=1 Tax=Butyrivibrio proteoclasticus (strain ATCC 51982 / DSM 14932 / B316) TaxID=515622 RepID=E0S3Q0_BUTPB|nr:hypothetical protein [Butyrivibrio proteoclasticus]ADL36032.1 hypothetical protein bpr_II093 [Butyrivibrio proteoclasticus B316]